jgi:hypothetical protein
VPSRGDTIHVGSRAPFTGSGFAWDLGNDIEFAVRVAIQAYKQGVAAEALLYLKDLLESVVQKTKSRNPSFDPVVALCTLDDTASVEMADQAVIQQVLPVSPKRSSTGGALFHSDVHCCLGLHARRSSLAGSLWRLPSRQEQVAKQRDGKVRMIQ